MLLSELFLPVLMVMFMLTVGAYVVAVLDRLIAGAFGAPQAGRVWLAPMARGAWLMTQHANATEAPDWQLASPWLALVVPTSNSASTPRIPM